MSDRDENLAVLRRIEALAGAMCESESIRDDILDGSFQRSLRKLYEMTLYLCDYYNVGVRTTPCDGE
jgi:hypothetical protein